MTQWLVIVGVIFAVVAVYLAVAIIVPWVTGKPLRTNPGLPTV